MLYQKRQFPLEKEVKDSLQVKGFLSGDLRQYFPTKKTERMSQWFDRKQIFFPIFSFWQKQPKSVLDHTLLLILTEPK